MSTSDFYLADQMRTLFPMQVNKLLVQHASVELDKYIYQKVLPGGEHDDPFLPQTRVYAAKPRWHLRRTVKLDPVAEYFVYDLVYRNRAKFRRQFSDARKHYGYRFEKGVPVISTSAYGEFRSAILAHRSAYRYCVTFDIASYFNSIYHHDLASWFKSLGTTKDDADGFSQFLRQINSGRSIDCLPQGLYPTKMLGSHFLIPVDTSNRIRSAQLTRFMDDFYLFDNDADVLIGDFLQIQRLLDARGLSINPKKTLLFETSDPTAALHGSIDSVKIELLKKRRREIRASPDPSEDPPEPVLLTDAQKEYLLGLLQDDSIDEDDAELVLALMQEHTEDVVEYLGILIKRFPNLAKRIHVFCGYVDDVDAVTTILLEFLKNASNITEFQLFWLAWIVEDYLLNTKGVGELLIKLFEAEGATDITRARILEIPENRFGMPDLREEHLKTGQSGWLSWAAAAGTRTQEKAHRNHVLKYFSNGSAINRLVSGCVADLP